MRYGVFAIGALRCLLYGWFLLKGIQKGRMGEFGNIALGGAFSMAFQVFLFFITRNTYSTGSRDVGIVMYY